MTIQNIQSHPAKHVSPEEAAEYLVVPRRTVYHWIDKGALQAVRVGGLLRIKTEELQRFAGTPARHASQM